MAGATTPLPTTREDFRLPGTQPLSITDPIAVPSTCTPCHANYGQPDVEPYRNWQTSMMAHSGRDPLMWAALAIANQDAPHSGETCLRCHLPKGWLEGRSAPEDGSTMTADETLDYSRHIVLPGLVNTHHHMVQSLSRVIAQDDELFGWLKTLYPIWSRLTGEAVYTASKLAMAELMLSGCTTASDHLYIYPNGCRLDDEIRAAQEIHLATNTAIELISDRVRADLSGEINLQR
jgi:hypothetical protein